jgi:hypothetical protein
MSSKSIGIQRLFTELQKTLLNLSDGGPELVRSKTGFHSLQSDSRDLHRTCPVPDQLSKSFHRILERSIRLVRWPHRTCLVKDSPTALFDV